VISNLGKSATVTHSRDPFDHWVIDDFLLPEQAADAAEHFLEGDGNWTEREHLYSHLKWTRTVGLHPSVERVLSVLEGPTMVHYMEAITGLQGLSSDPDRYGGGQHAIWAGGYLGVHADFTHHPKTDKRRALNLLLYLNPGWTERDGGELELWAPDMSRCVRRIQPRHNRAVLFRTSPTSFHGHPEPLRGYIRKSLAVYYYQTDDGSPRLRTTDYHPRPGEYYLQVRRWISRLVKGR
jgi:Rps23 Pro-64 3,4-dihydroxylase Tpa1-like proline 4-hydroxylase